MLIGYMHVSTDGITRPWTCSRAIAVLREAEDVPDHLLAHLSPLGWKHINLTSDYVWSSGDEATENHDGFRPLWAAPDPALMAA